MQRCSSPWSVWRACKMQRRAQPAGADQPAPSSGVPILIAMAPHPSADRKVLAVQSPLSDLLPWHGAGPMQVSVACPCLRGLPVPGFCGFDFFGWPPSVSCKFTVPRRAITFPGIRIPMMAGASSGSHRGKGAGRSDTQKKSAGVEAGGKNQSLGGQMHKRSVSKACVRFMTGYCFSCCTFRSTKPCRSAGSVPLAAAC